MALDLEQEKEELLRRIEKTMDRRVRKVLATLTTTHQAHPKVKFVTSTEGTSNASSK